MLKLFAQVLPVDSGAVEQASSAVAGMTQPILGSNSFDIEGFIQRWGDAFLNFGVRVILALVLFFIGSWLIKRLRRFIEKMLLKRQIEGVAVSLINSIVVAFLYIGLGIGIASVLGVQSVSFAAVLASMGLAVGMALSGQLQNLAGGVIIVLTKPFTTGDYIQGQGVEGVVKMVTLFHTIVTTPENKVIYIPNGGLSNNVIVNFNGATTRRVDWVVNVDYHSNIDEALELLNTLITRDERVLRDPAHFVAVQALSPNSVELVARAWVKSEHYWDVYFDFNKAVFEAFNAAGISFPFPQLTISKRPEAQA